MARVIYHGLLGATLLFGLAWAVPAGADGYEHDCDEACGSVFYVPPIPRLVGYGCEGAGGPLYANEEDHFPKCEVIEAWPR